MEAPHGTEKVVMDGDIELELASGSEPGEYTVRVVQAPAGGNASGLLRLDVDGILARRAELESTVLASAVAARRTTPVAELPVRGVGRSRGVHCRRQHQLKLHGDPHLAAPQACAGGSGGRP
ncbi:hypothetical protein Arth_4093 [Arthrobacter sp. FB24]|nr:hypothetical protein Arth_4093 [Arthrobacter sp. FB24]